MNLTQLRELHRAKVLKTWAAAQEKAANGKIEALNERLISQMVDEGQSSGKWDMPHDDEVLAAFLTEQLAAVQARVERAGPRTEKKTFYIHAEIRAWFKEGAKTDLVAALQQAGMDHLITLNNSSLSSQVREEMAAAGIDKFADEIDISGAAPGWGQFVNVSRKTTLNMTKGT